MVRIENSSSLLYDFFFPPLLCSFKIFKFKGKKKKGGKAAMHSSINSRMWILLYRVKDIHFRILMSTEYCMPKTLFNHFYSHTTGSQYSKSPFYGLHSSPGKSGVSPYLFFFNFISVLRFRYAKILPLLQFIDADLSAKAYFNPVSGRCHVNGERIIVYLFILLTG